MLIRAISKHQMGRARALGPGTALQRRTGGRGREMRLLHGELDRCDRLTPAQQAVLELMAEGLHDDAIAHRVGISTTTVRRHITAIIDRLGVRSRFAAGAAAQRRGWIG
jgi:DNA-binding NarL/FixJ family response regulator